MKIEVISADDWNPGKAIDAVVQTVNNYLANGWELRNGVTVVPMVTGIGVAEQPHYYVYATITTDTTATNNSSIENIFL